MSGEAPSVSLLPMSFNFIEFVCLFFITGRKSGAKSAGVIDGDEGNRRNGNEYFGDDDDENGPSDNDDEDEEGTR